MRLQLGVTYAALSEYVLNNAQAWEFPQLVFETEQQSAASGNSTSPLWTPQF